MANDDAFEQPHRWYSTNLVGVPARVLASTEFNANSQCLAIAGAREAQPGLFALLDRSRDLNEARDMFVHYLVIAFGLRKPEPHELAAMGVA